MPDKMTHVLVVITVVVQLARTPSYNMETRLCTPSYN